MPGVSDMLYVVPQRWTSEQLEALGERVRHARQALDITIDDAAGRAPMSPVTWGKVENGGRAKGLTYAGIERVLGWKSGTIEGFLAKGIEPVATERPTTPPPRRSFDEGIAEEIKKILDDQSLGEEEQVELAQILMDAWSKDEREARRRRIDQIRTIADAYKKARGA